MLDTQNYSYGDLFSEINIKTGGIEPSVDVYSNVERTDDCVAWFELSAKVLYENIPAALAFMQEILLTSRLDDAERLYEILAEGKSRFQAHFMAAGHRVASSRALSYGSQEAAFVGLLSGIPLYRLVCELEEHFDQKQAKLSKTLYELCNQIFCRDNLLIDFTGDREVLLESEALFEELISNFSPNMRREPISPLQLTKRQEGLKTAGQVQYVSVAGNFRKKGLPYRGELQALKVLLSYDYLWNHIRVKGGAYGCMCAFQRNGDSFFVSYRDPNLLKTIEIFRMAAQEIEQFSADERTMTKTIIGAISSLDRPLGAKDKGRRALAAYLTNLTYDATQKAREELLDATIQNIRDLSRYIRAFLEDDYLCVVGSNQCLEENASLFEEMADLL